MTMGSSRHPPSVVTIKIIEGPSALGVAMEMRLPVHLWAILSRGREAETAEVSRIAWRAEGDASDRERWQEWDGEQHWKWRDEEGRPQARKRTVYVVQRMQWARIDGVWRGKWWGEEYDRVDEREYWERRYVPLIASSAPWGSVPQEVLLIVVHAVHDVSDRPLYILH